MVELIKEIKDIAVSIKSWAIIITCTIFFAAAAIFVSLFGSAENTQKVARLWGKTIIKLLGIKVDISGIENADPSKSYLIVSNHQSYFDIFVLLACLDLNFKFIAKASLFKIPFLGWSMKRLGYIPLDRKNLKSALKTVRNLTPTLKTDKNWSILIFPEGTRSNDGKLSSFKKGGLNKLIISSDYILPVAINGTYDILKKGSIMIYPKNPVKLTILNQINVNAADTKGIKSDEDFILNIEKKIGEAV
ncbi:MAG: 1-acyl-sn-glycerol-3-phosphate acyltransferase [Deltaproteobacteria bacterium]|jgi:1-acyl-sn-glycerol-3-phosphate acyltransferase|nr:1-acyl-sn-glycerol-3-phosphate acyltransferase [Deltaproteobacteria bacterium]MCL5879604.1 1-acyl-sn-glycerol-3-phosphate acyltransferase [Deltaproteobacteria bacterium]